MIKLSKLEEVQELVKEREVLVSRIEAMQGRDMGWLECFFVRAGFYTVFGNDETSTQKLGVSYTESFYATAEQLAQAIERYLKQELANVEAALERLGVQITEE